MERLIREAAEIWKRATHPIAFTGAGISVPSGIPDFRSPGGLWTKYDPMKVATAQAITDNPKGVWEFLIDTIDLLERAQPNPAHLALAELEKKNKLMAIITQNVDNLHQRAGSKNVIEYHGNFENFYCNKCKKGYSKEETKNLLKKENPPRCECGGIIRPEVVFFGEPIPPLAYQQSLELIKKTDLLLIVGTSGEVAPANTIPRAIKSRGGKIIEINLGETYYYDISDIRFDYPVEEVLPLLKDELLSK